MPSQKDIVEVVFPFYQQSQTEKTHSIVVISTEDIMNIEDGMFYGVLLSGEKQPEEFSVELTEDMINILNEDVQKKFTHVKAHMIYPFDKNYLGNIKHIGTVTNEAFEVIKNQIIKSIFIEIDDH